jgi:hypothetical protein
MPLSDQLSALAVRAKNAEDHAAAAEQKARAEIEHDIEAARTAAAARGEALQKKAKSSKESAAAGWDKLQRSWNEHLASLKESFDEKKGEHEVKAAQRRAYGAEEDANWAVDMALAAVEEAEYAVLNAVLARKEADELEHGVKG